MPDSEEKWPIMPPPPSRHGTATTSVGDLLSWRAEIRTSISEVGFVEANHRAHHAKTTIIDSQLQAAYERRRTAWETYIHLYGDSTEARLPSLDSDVSARAKGKRKAISLGDEDDANDDRVSRALGDEEDPSLAFMDLE